VLLDTQVWLWMNAAHRRLGPTALNVIYDPQVDRLLSVASCWEITIKYALGKLALAAEPRAYFEERLPTTATELLPITLEDVLRTGRLPHVHGDPFDRMLVAQALVHRIPVITADRRFAEYGVEVIPVGP